MHPEPLTCRKREFSLPDDVHYLNAAYMSPLSRRVVEAGVAGIGRKALPFEIRAPDFFDGANEVRRLFARLIGSDAPERVAIVPSASYAFAQVARNVPLARGQNVVLVGEEFPSNVYIWRRACVDSGAELRVVPAPTAGRWSDRILDALDTQTAAVSLGGINWTDGTPFDLEAIGARARECGAVFAVDGSQFVGAMPFDVVRTRPDVVVCPAYKWLMGPYSIGAAWFGERFDDGVPIEESWMTRRGSEDFAGLVRYVDEYRPGAIRYDVGETSNWTLMPMLIESLTQVLEWQPERIQQYGRRLTGGLVDRLRDGGFTVADDTRRPGHLFGFRLPPGTDPIALRERLEQERIFVSVRGDAIRVSVHLFNDEGDIDALARAVLG